MPIRGHYINNQWMAGTGLPFTSHNPATGEMVWSGHAATDHEVNNAVAAARSAFAEWARLPLDARISCLTRFREILNAEANALSEAISKETGKPLWESKNEVRAMAGKIDISIDAYHVRCPEVTQKQAHAALITRHKPHGVIAILGPFNFPGHLPNGHIIPALLAGNVIVFKPSESTPFVAELMMHCWEQAGLPPGVLNMIQGGRETGRALVNNLDINGLFFTGSWVSGHIFAELFGKHPEKILALEMGGNNPLIVSQVSNLKIAALTTIQSAFATAGQRCSCARRLIIPEGPQGDAFLSELINMAQTIKVGPYTDTPEPYMGPVISTAAASHLLAAQETIKVRGGTPLLEMHLKKIDTALLSPGIIEVSHVANRPDEEIFGPLLQVIRTPDFESAIIEANRTSYGLTAGLLSDNESEYRIFYQKVRAGVINWNTPLTGASGAAPFGGVGHSGNHRPSAYYTADYCSYPVASMETSELKPPDQLPPGIQL